MREALALRLDLVESRVQVNPRPSWSGAGPASAPAFVLWSYARLRARLALAGGKVVVALHILGLRGM